MVNHCGRISGLLYAVTHEIQVLTDALAPALSTECRRNVDVYNADKEARTKCAHNRAIDVQRAMRVEGIRLAVQWPSLGR
jgi:hypothetical protein